MSKNVLITGASRGIGRAAAEAFAKEGYELYLTCINSKDALYDFKLYLEDNYHVICHTFCGDMGDYETVASLFKQIPKLDVLINNAGISHTGLLTDMSYGEWEQIVRTNLTSCFNTCKHAIPLMLREKKGKIINVSSIWGNHGASMEVAYSATKGGVNSFTKALAKELAPSNIQVNAAAFGAIDTDMMKEYSTEDIRLICDEIPADRLGTPDEAAKLILGIAQSPDYLTGQVITMDGGWY